MTNILQAIDWLYDDEFNSVFKNIGKELWEDLRQEIALIVLEYDREKLLEIESKGKKVFKFWIVRTCCNQLHSKNGPMWKMYNHIIPVEDVTRFIKEVDEIDNSQATIDIIYNRIQDLYWYDKEILKMYIELGSVRKVSAHTGIPHTSIFITIKNIRKCIKKYIP